MNLITERIQYHSRTDEFRLWHLTDTHIGARSCDEKLLKRHIKQIVDDPFALALVPAEKPKRAPRKTKAA